MGKENPRKKGQQVIKSLLLFSFLLFTNSCSDHALSLFFDVPPPTPEELAAKAEAQARAEALIMAARAGVDITGLEQAAAPADEPKVELPPPEIESVTSWEEAESYFPKDKEGRKGMPDWTEAVRRGIIRPRESVDGSPRPAGQVFLYDFFIPGNEPGYEAYFPHSTHTEWLTCESCHPKLFPVRGEKMTKDEIKAGKFCGACHQKRDGPAFYLRSCDRCHLLAED